MKKQLRDGRGYEKCCRRSSLRNFSGVPFEVVKMGCYVVAVFESACDQVILFFLLPQSVHLFLHTCVSPPTPTDGVARIP